MDSPAETVDAGVSPRKSTSSTRVIESLHRQLDELKLEVLNYQNKNAELKKANEIVVKRRDQLVEQLSNVKHENDTVNSLLHRKERRIASLEEQLNDVACSSDDLKFKVKSLETRCNKLQENEASSVAEYERIKIAYDIMVTSQKEYRDYYSSEIKSLKERLEIYIKEKDTQIQKNITLINKSDATIYRSIKSIRLRSREIEDKYTKRDEELSRTMEKLQKAVGFNTQDTQILLDSSKKLFNDVAEVLKIDKVRYLDANLSEEDGEDLNVARGLLKEKVKEEPKLVVKKRGDRHGECEIEASSVEERVRLLSKELNNAIPPSDRTVSLEPVKTKPTRKLKAASKSEERVLSSELSGDSRRSSRLFDEVKASVSTASTEPNSQIESSPEPQDQEVLTNSEISKKRRRRKKKRGKKASTTNQADAPSENESS